MLQAEPLDGFSELDRLRFAAIVDSSEDAIVSKDLDGRIRSWNPAAERIFGYSAEEMIGGSIFRLVPDELIAEERELLSRIRAGEHVAHYETSRIRKDGRRILVSLTLSPVWATDGRVVGASAIKRDITTQRSVEARLQQALRMEAIGRLAGGIAHDFNNLLTVIGGMTGLVLRRHSGEDRDRRDLEQIALAVDRATVLTQQLLAFSRPQLADIEVLDPNQIVRSMEPMLRRLIGEHIRFETHLASDLGQLRSNRGQIEQVIMNLAVNARDAMPDGGTMTVETQNVDVSGGGVRELPLEPGPYVVITVSDTGAGMDELTQASIFEPFFTTKGAGQGTGLGLATVYGIVQQAGGGIDVCSESGRGSVFSIYMPQVAPVGEPASTARPPRPMVEHPRGAATILLAEDEPGVRAYTRQVLEESGYEVLEAESGEAALAAAAAYERPIDLLLTDVVMPGINGRMLAERLRATRPDVVVLFMSGYTDDMVLRAGVATAGTAFLQKPFTAQVLLERIRMILPTAVL